MEDWWWGPNGEHLVLNGLVASYWREILRHCVFVFSVAEETDREEDVGGDGGLRDGDFRQILDCHATPWTEKAILGTSGHTTPAQ